MRKADVVQFDAQVLEDGLGAGEDGDVLEHGLAAVAITGGLHRGDLQHALELVDHQGGEHFALDVLGNHQQRAFGLGDFLQQGHQLGDRADLLFVDEDVGFVELADHLVLVGHEMGRKIPAVELHTFDEFDIRLEALARFDGDDAVAADALEGLGHDLANFAVVVGGDAGDVDDVVGLADVDGLGQRLELGDGGLGAFFHATLEGHGVGSGGQVLVRLAEHRLGEHGGGSGSVAGDFGGLAGGLLDELGAEVLALVAQLDLLGDGDAVLGHVGAPPALVDHGVATTRAQSRLDRLGELLDPGQQTGSRLCLEREFFDCHNCVPP